MLGSPELSSCAQQPLHVVEAALAILQVLAASARTLLLFTAQAHTTREAEAVRATGLGLWGLARSVRFEAEAPIKSVDVSQRGLVECWLALDSIAMSDLAEPELALREGQSHAPRLEVALLFGGSEELITSDPLHRLFGKQPAVTAGANGAAASLAVRAVCLNLHDVLNELREAPDGRRPLAHEIAGTVSRSSRPSEVVSPQYLTHQVSA
jgi:hypothetical protein